MANVNTTARAEIVTAREPTIYNLSMPIASTEYAQVLSPNTRKLMIRMRVKSKSRFAFVSGDTATNYITIEGGCTYSDENFRLVGATIYLRSETAGQTAEILEWV
jgi:hypothetical protein